MATWYISPSGNDSTGAGTSGAPWATFAKFLSSSTSGDTCICAAGTYVWATATITNRTVQAATGATVIFDGAAANVHWTVTNSTIRNLQFEDALQVYFDCRGEISFYACKFVGLSWLNNFGGYGLFCTLLSSLSHVLNLTGCLFDDCDRGGSAASTAFFCSEVSPLTWDINVVNCVFCFATTTGSRVLITPQNSTPTIDFAFTNCVFVNTSGQTITWSSHLGGGTNNNLTSRMDYCCNYSNAIASAPSGTGNITSDPLFVDAANENFNLRPTSPCINAGTLA